MIRNEQTANVLMMERATAMQAAQAFWNVAPMPTRTVVRKSWFRRLFNI